MDSVRTPSRRLLTSALVVFGIPAVLCLVLPTGWWKVGAVVPVALLAGAVYGCPYVVARLGLGERRQEADADLHRCD